MSQQVTISLLSIVVFGFISFSAGGFFSILFIAFLIKSSLIKD